MLSKNNLRLLDERNAQQHQRFGLRKLTIGVASVLLGTTFMIGTAHASVDQSSTPTSTPVTLKTQSTSITNDQTINYNNGLSRNDHQPETTTFQTAVTQPATVQTVTENKTQDVATPTFSGMTNWEPNNTDKKWTGNAADVQYKAGDQSTINYVIQSWGGTNVANSADYQGSSKYLIMIPAGFDTQALTPNRSDAALGYQLQDLGLVGPNGERTFMLTLAQTPSYGALLNISATISPLATAGGAYTLYNQWAPLLMPLNDHMIATGESGAGGGTGTITLKNGTTYTYVRDLTSFNNAQWWDNNSKPAYTIVPGVQQLATGNYKVTGVKANKVDATQTGQAGYEEIEPTIQITGTVKNGDYIDFHLGIPYRDVQTGKTKYITYDHNLAKEFKVANVGTIYNMGDYYRLVFDNQLGLLNNPTFSLQLKWGANGQQASLNNWQSNYVYQTTTDPEKDHTQFKYTPTNDVTINGQTMASGFTVNGQYIYTAQPIGVGNAQIGAGTSYSTNRTWNQKGDVRINTQWNNVQNASLSTKDLGDEFDIRTTITKDPTGQVSFAFTSANDLAKAIEKSVAANDQQSLVNEVVNDGQTYVKMNSKAGEKPKIKAAVTMTVTTDAKNPNQDTAVWHVKLTNLEPEKNPKIVLKGSVPVVTASANNFTMPDGITSYDQDMAAEKTVATSTYNGAKTNNTALMKVLQTLPVSLTQFVSYQNGHPKDYSGIFGAPWKAGISYDGNHTVDGEGSAADLVTNTLSFKDIDSGQTVANDVSYQGATGSTVKFEGGQTVYDGLKGYHFVKAVSVHNGQETVLTNFDPAKLADFSFGTAGKNQPHEFIIYVQKDQPVQQTASVTEIIYYKFGSKSGQDASPSFKKTVNYTKTGDKDWQPDGNFTKVVSPIITGYTVNYDQIDAPKPTDLKDGAQETNTYYVIYTANEQTAQIKYVDDTTGKTLNTDHVTGSYNSQIDFKNDPDQQIADYQKQHYILVSNDFQNDPKYQVDNQKNCFTVHLKHDLQNVTKTTTKTRTINYFLANGKSAAKSVEQTVTFTGTAQHDMVTNHTGDYTWKVTTGDANLKAVTSPKITGYHVSTVESSAPDQVDGQNVRAMVMTPNSDDVGVTVYYAENQQAELNFVDDETGNVIHPAIAVNGEAGKPIDFGDVQSIVNQLAKQHYVLANVTNDTPATTALMVLTAVNTHQIAGNTVTNWQKLFGNFTDADQSFTIHFTHAHGLLNAQHQQTVTETVNYQDQKGNQLATPYTMTLTFNGTGYRDLVTNQDIVTDWELANGNDDNGSFASVANPQIKGYHVVAATDDQGNDVLDTTTNQVKAQTRITHTSPDIQVLVTYAVDPQPTQPTKPTKPVKPTEPTKPVQPTKPVEPTRPTQPIQPTEPTEPTRLVTTEHPKETQPVIIHAQGTPAETSHQNVTQNDSALQQNSASKTKAAVNRLPQTGSSNVTVIAGLGMASLLGIFGLARRKRSRK